MSTQNVCGLETVGTTDQATEPLVGRAGATKSHGVPRTQDSNGRHAVTQRFDPNSDRRRFQTLVSDPTVHFGGAFETALTLVEHLNRIESDTALLVSSQPAEFLETRVAGRIPTRQFFGFEPNLTKVPRALLPLKVARDLMLRELPTALRYARLIRELGASVVHLNGGLSTQLYALLASRLTGARCVVTFHGNEYPSRLIKPFRSLVDRFIVISETVKRHAVDALEIPECKIVSIYDPVDTDIFNNSVKPADLEVNFGLPPGRKVFSIFGRLDPWKGHIVFLKAARLVLEAIPDAHALIVGDTADADPHYGVELRALSRELGIADRTTFAGYRADIAPLMRASDVLVHASIEPEPFGMVVAEGMACGRPYVAMDEGGPPEMIDDGVHGLLIRPNEPEAMAKAIITLLIQSELAESFGKAARVRCVEKFAAPLIARQHLELYREVAGLAGKSRQLGS